MGGLVGWTRHAAAGLRSRGTAEAAVVSWIAALRRVTGGEIREEPAAFHQAGLPSLKRSVSVSPPFTTSRARVRSAPSCLTLEPVTSSASAALNSTPMSSRNFLGQRKTCTTSEPLFMTRYAIGFPPEGVTSFNSSTVPRNVVSVAGSYLGDACAKAEVVRQVIAASFSRLR